MSNTEENYLDNLLKAVSEPDEAAPAKEEHAEASIEDKLGASLGIPEDVIPEVTDAEEIPPDEPIVLEDEPEEAVVDTEAIEEPDVPELGETVEEMEQQNEQDEPEFVETVEEPPEPETDEDLFAALMNEDANEIHRNICQQNRTKNRRMISVLQILKVMSHRILTLIMQLK